MMLKPRASLALLARALRRSAAAPAASVFSLAPWSALTPPTSRRYSSFTPQGGRPTSKTKPSFAIAAAFEGHEDLEDPDEEANEHLFGHNDEYESEEDERARALREQFQRGMEKKQLWMQSLAAQDLYAAVVKSVADCYAPLYEAMGLQDKCPLLAVARDAAKDERELETQYQPLRFDDMLTKATEQEALALLVIARQPELAITVVEHRDRLAQELLKRAKAGAGVVLPGATDAEDENVVTLDSHLRMFYSWAMSAYSLCGPTFYPQLFDVYKRVRDAEGYVTANMNVQYVSVLNKQKRFDDAVAFYESVTRENLPASVFFYRQMLYTACVTRNEELLDSLLEDMRVKGFKLRADDYLHAIRVYDDEYFFTEHVSKDKRWRNQKKQDGQATPELVTPRDSFDMCVQRIREQEDHPERFEKLLDASQSVLALFDTMVDVDGLAPRHEQLFPRVITAAVYAQECERVPELLALHAEHSDKPLHYAGVLMGVNALLLLDKPTEAWGLIRETNPDLESHRFGLVKNVFRYLCFKKRGADIVALLHDVDKLGLRDVFALKLIKSMVPALCGSVDNVSDQELMATMTHFDDIFRLRTSEFHLGVFLSECSRNGRLEAVKAALRQWSAVSDHKHPLKGSVAVRLLEAFERESDWAFMAEVFDLIDFARVKSDEDGDTIVSAVSRAYTALGQPERVERAERVKKVAGMRQKQLRQHKSTKQQDKSTQRRPERTAAAPRASIVMVNGIPVTSSSS